MSLLCFGEVLVDLLSNDSQPEQFTKFAGGAPANVAVAYAKLGGNASFVGMLGKDKFGDFLEQELQQAGVHTKYCKRTAKAQTALAFICLDKHNERDFTFYRSQTADLLFKAHDFCLAAFQQHEIFHMCSNSLCEQAIFQTTLKGLEQAKAACCLISFDINLRTHLWQTPKHIYSRVMKVIASTDILKLNEDELKWLTEHAKPEHAKQDLIQLCFQLGVQVILLTRGKQHITCYTQNSQMDVTPPSCDTIDTTAAGDAFIGGFLYAMSQQIIHKQPLSASQLRESIVFASYCGSFCVTRSGAFSALPTQDDINTFVQSI
tara:strand:- start:7744 stop:8700 length:957 start_codon:yes stop_codon:yes gene_type:complete